MPREFFAGDKAPARLMTLGERHMAFVRRGLDGHVCARFDAALAGTTPEAFIDALLVRALGARSVVVGHDFRFGRERSGNVATLRAAGARCGFEVREVEAQYHAGVRISSTAVRRALAASDFAAAAALLGRPFAMCGRVVHGERLGRTLGFATANLRPRRRVLPLHGIFAVTVSDDGALVRHPAVASLGTRPTVGGRGHLLEVHLFDFQGNLYGRRLRVEFVAKLRDEAHFGSVTEMTAQMHRDAQAARTALAAVKP
jgi:riboflavin kinase/FMN adenylyltransferase